jgi:ATP-dependent DNA helicase RecG
LQNQANRRIRKGLSLFKVNAADDSAELQITFFNAKYTADALKYDTEYLFYGRMEGTFTAGRWPRRWCSRLGKRRVYPGYPLTQGLPPG